MNVRRWWYGLTVKKPFYDLLYHLGYDYNLNLYDAQYLLDNQKEGLAVAEWFVPLLLEEFKFKSVIDVGCATGHFLYYCLEKGVKDVCGVEGSPQAFPLMLVAGMFVREHDLRQPLNFDRKWDLCVSLEVAEHIDERWSNIYVQTLCRSSDTILLTTALPHQMGLGHVNEQTPSYWIKLFKEFGFRQDERKTMELKKRIHEKTLEGKYAPLWLQPNIRVFRKER